MGPAVRRPVVSPPRSIVVTYLSPLSAVQNHSSGRAPRQSLMRAEYFALAVLCVIAALLRFWGLGSLGLEVDEGVQGLTVQGWLDSGLPVLPSGMMYRRAIPFGAIQALSARTFGLDEFALRLPAALFGVLAVPVTFALARVLFDRRIAWTAVTASAYGTPASSWTSTCQSAS